MPHAIDAMGHAATRFHDAEYMPHAAATLPHAELPLSPCATATCYSDAATCYMPHCWLMLRYIAVDASDVYVSHKRRRYDGAAICHMRYMPHATLPHCHYATC
jgi:hypothetical protein